MFTQPPQYFKCTANCCLMLCTVKDIVSVHISPAIAQTVDGRSLTFKLYVLNILAQNGICCYGNINDFIINSKSR